MRLTLTKDQIEWMAEIQAFLDEELPEHRQRSTEFDDSDDHWEFARQFTECVGRKGWLGLTWPTEWGGLQRSKYDLAILREELEYRSAPLVNAVGHNLVANTLLNFGSAHQKRRWLPRILSTSDIWVEGLSEPGAGSDLAALQTQAVERDGAWVITGQKTYVSWAHRGDIIYLAARTDPSSTGYRGISLFAVDLSSRGVSIHPMPNIAGGRQNHVFFDEVRVPPDCLIGRVDHGWECIMSVIYSGAGDPMVSIGRLRRIYDLMHEQLERQGRLGDAFVRCRLAELLTEIEALSILRWQDIWRSEEGKPVQYGGALAGLLYREFAPRLAQTVVELVGPDSFAGQEDAPFELSTYFLESFGNHGGGTPQLKRLQIATRGLNLPR